MAWTYALVRMGVRERALVGSACGSDSPDSSTYQTVRPLRAMDPRAILSTRLAPALGQTTEFLDILAEAPRSDPFVGPDQHALEELLASFEPVTATR
jgi:hypothetical protein